MQTGRMKFREGVNKLLRTSPQDDPQVAEALSDLGWKGNGPVFGCHAAPHCLEAGIPRGQFILAPSKLAAGPCSFDFMTAGSDGFAFQEFLGMWASVLNPTVTVFAEIVYPYAGNISRFTPGEDGHDISTPPFFKKKSGGGLRLFNKATAYFWFNCFGLCNNLAGSVLPGRPPLTSYHSVFGP